MSIKLEIGKKYVCRNGAVVGPLEKDSNTTLNFPFFDPNRPVGPSHGSEYNWMWNGKFALMDEHPLDIVAEYHEYVWKWMVPDKPGVWMSGRGSRSDIPDRGRSIIVYDISTWPPGWYCFLMDIPSIQMPPKQRVTKRLWLRKIHELTVGADIRFHQSYDERWETEEVTPEGWISTNVTKEVEQ